MIYNKKKFSKKTGKVSVVCFFLYLCGINNNSKNGKTMARKINYKAVLEEETANGNRETVYNTYGMPGVVFVESRRSDGTDVQAGWLSVGYVKKARAHAGLKPQFEDSKNENA